MAKKNEQKGPGLTINFDKGERAYQYHFFEDADGKLYTRISSKINKNGEIEVAGFLKKPNWPPVALGVNKPTTKQEFDKIVNWIIDEARKTGLSHRFVDLSNLKTIEEQIEFLQKTEPGTKIVIRHKNDLVP